MANLGANLKKPDFGKFDSQKVFVDVILILKPSRSRRLAEVREGLLQGTPGCYEPFRT